jgi:hypothetical protein
MGWARLVAFFGEVNNACKILIGKPKWHGPVGRDNCARENNINLNNKEICCDCVARVVGYCEHVMDFRLQ